MGPIHRDFCDMVSALLCDVEQFEIEAIAINRRDSEEVCCHGLTEQFKAALRVGNSSEAALPHDGLKIDLTRVVRTVRYQRVWTV